MIHPFGVDVMLGEKWSAMISNDGVHTHLSASRGFERLVVRLLAVRPEDPGITIGMRF